MSGLWFSQTELQQLATPVVQRLSEAIRHGSIREAIRLCDELAGERIVLHDLLADSTTALVTWICRHLGEQSLADAYVYIFEQSAKRTVYDVLPSRLDRSVEAALLARSCWLAHCCSGAGQHPASFRLEEDEEKFTFIMDPCGSGGRLWRMGRYGPPFDFGLSSKAYSWSFKRKAFPYYCVHCAFLNEILPRQYLGYSLWPVDPPSGPEGECRWTLYKDRKRANQRPHERAAHRSKNGVPKRRCFSADQLEQMSTFTPVRIRRLLENGDRRGAVRVCRQRAGEFLFLHNLYVSGLASGLDFVAQRAGEQALGDVFRDIYRKCVKNQILPLIEGLSRKNAIGWLMFNLFLASTSGGAGHPPAKISVTENASAITVTLDPCASGGKLIRNGAFDQMGNLRTAREALENYLIHASSRLPIPSSLMELSVIRVVDYLSETRKPSALKTTSKAFPWSGESKGLPYYCALCTGLLHESGCDWISVKPPGPAKHKHSCTWRFRK